MSKWPLRGLCLVLFGGYFPGASYAMDAMPAAGGASTSAVEAGPGATEVPGQTAPYPEKAPPGTLSLIADLRVHSADELYISLKKVDSLFQQSSLEYGNPVVFLLHGEEAKTLFRQNYSANKRVVDLAARLSAFGVVDIKVCETWAGNNSLDTSRLQPFVGTVPLAPAEAQRLKARGYTSF